jgi:hypothetical protein
LRIVRETNHLSSILVGIENSAPHKENFFGGKHTAAAKNQDTSPFGTRKWKDYRKGGQEVPADIGGMHVSVDETAFKSLQRLAKKVELSKPMDGYKSGIEGNKLRDEKDLFKELLQSSDQQADEVLHKRLRFTRPALHGHAGTMVFDQFVRNKRSVVEEDEDDADEDETPMTSQPSTKGIDGEDLGDSDDEGAVDYEAAEKTAVDEPANAAASTIRPVDASASWAVASSESPGQVPTEKWPLDADGNPRDPKTCCSL